MKRPQVFTSKINALIVLFFLISLIIHGFLFYLFCWSSFSKKNRPQDCSQKQKTPTVIFFDSPEQQKTQESPVQKTTNPENEQKKPEPRMVEDEQKLDVESKRPAQMRAPLSDFGWQLDQEPENVELKIPEIEDGSIDVNQPVQIDTQELQEAARLDKQEDTEKSPTPSDQDQQEAPASDETQQKIAKNESLEALKQTPIFEKQLTLSEPIQEKPEKPKPALQRKPFRMHDVSAPHKLLSEKNSHKKSDTFIDGKQGIRIRGARKEVRDDASKEPKPNIISLTKGFIEKHWGDGGTDLVDCDGDPNKHPSLAELKYASYNSKVLWSLQSAWKQNFMYSAPSFEIRFVRLGLTINEKGFLTDAKILEPSGCSKTDNLVLKTAHLAAPFPPLPKHFNTTSYPLNLHIEIRH